MQHYSDALKIARIVELSLSVGQLCTHSTTTQED